MSEYTNNPHDFTNVESLKQLTMYKLENRGIGNVPDLEDYVDVADEYFTQIYLIGSETPHMDVFDGR